MEPRSRLGEGATEQPQQGSVTCIAAFLGETNWSRSKVGRVLGRVLDDTVSGSDVVEHSLRCRVFIDKSGEIVSCVPAQYLPVG